MSVPRIRVDGFNKNFEKKIFGEIVRSESTRMYIKSVVSDLGKYEVIQQGDIPILGYSDDRPFEKYKSVILFGDHTLSLYRPKAPFLLATDGIKILQSTILKRDYLYYLTQNYIPKSQGYKRHFSVLKQVFVNYSRDSSEQSAIGSLFRTLDDLLASYKDNLANYQSLKATMLSKMFPKAGQTVPEIRLDGFEGEWEKLKLRDVVHTNPKSELPENFKYIDLESVVGTRINKIREERKTSAPSRAQRLAKKGDVFYQTVRPYQKNNYLFKLDEIDYVFSTGYAQLRPIFNRCDSDFLLILLQNNRFLSNVLDRCTGTSYPAINVNDLIEILIAIPSYEEQQAIGSYFSNLDNLINSHQEKITQLETLRKKLLQDMFI